jgi:hypothetical protein
MINLDIYCRVFASDETNKRIRRPAPTVSVANEAMPSWGMTRRGR